jgi:hypothetical protein
MRINICKRQKDTFYPDTLRVRNCWSLRGSADVNACKYVQLSCVCIKVYLWSVKVMFRHLLFGKRDVFRKEFITFSAILSPSLALNTHYFTGSVVDAYFFNKNWWIFSTHYREIEQRSIEKCISYTVWVIIVRVLVLRKIKANLSTFSNSSTKHETSEMIDLCSV